MTTHVYANLAPIGWTELTAENSQIDSFGKKVPPYIWWEENANIYAPLVVKEPDTLYQFPYVHIYYENKTYRVSPYHLQIVEG